MSMFVIRYQGTTYGVEGNSARKAAEGFVMEHFVGHFDDSINVEFLGRTRDGLKYRGLFGRNTLVESFEVLA